MKKIVLMVVLLLVAPLYAGGHEGGITHYLTKGIVEILNSRAKKDTASKDKKKKNDRKKKRRGRKKKK